MDSSSGVGDDNNIITQSREFADVLPYRQFAVEQHTEVTYDTGRVDRDCADM